MPHFEHRVRNCHCCESEVDFYAQVCPICGEKANVLGAYGSQRSRSSALGCEDSSKCCRVCSTVYDSDSIVCPICGDPRFRPVRGSAPADERLSWSNKARLKVRTPTGVREVVVPMPSSPAAGQNRTPPPRASTAPPMPRPSNMSSSSPPSNSSDAASQEGRGMLESVRSLASGWSPAPPPRLSPQQSPAALAAGVWSPVTDWFISPSQPQPTSLPARPPSAATVTVSDYMFCARTSAPNFNVRGIYPPGREDGGGGYVRVKSNAATGSTAGASKAGRVDGGDGGGGGGGYGGERRCTSCGTVCDASGYVCPICGESTAAFARVVLHAPASIAAAYAVR